MPERYEPKSFEQKWRDRWQSANLFRTREDADRPKFYGLDFFPYPSGAGLSVGHCRNYIPTDVLCRMKYMQGFNVLHPMGFDAFGLPAENEAIAKKTHPAPMIKQYGANYKRQMDLVGISYDWSRSFYSSDPEYYRWTQWIFEKLYKRGLAYRKPASVNWCPVDKTVLADEEVEAGRCWRCGSLVEKKWIPQWYFKITAYAQRLLDDLDELDWPEGIKMLQRNWIGRSEGVEFDMRIVFEAPQADESVVGPDEDGFEVVPHKEREPHFRVFTTRIDTIFGMTFCVMAPEHPMVEEILRWASDERKAEIEAYRQAARELSDIDRQATTREKSGVFTGAYAINPANGKRVPIYVADYVLMGYGTGAIMAVPGHDGRDFEFAQTFGIDVIQVISPSEDAGEVELPFETKDGVLVNSGEYNGLTVAQTQQLMGEWMEGLGIGQRVVNYRLRDWLISRQRYWGCPIPVIHSKDGEIQLVNEGDLPVELPEVENYQPSGDGSSPLAGIDEFVNVTDLDGTLGHRETDTMGGFACSSWYFLRFCDPHNEEAAWDPDRIKYWMPVDCYVGGAEHAVMHLLYARFWTKVLFDEGLISVKEPFARLMNQGQVLAQTPYRKPIEGERLGVGEDGVLLSFAEADEHKQRIEAGELDSNSLFYRWARMSKSKGNVVTPDEMVEQFGADALRIYELFVAPFEADVQWSNDGVAGAARFLNRVFKMIHSFQFDMAAEGTGSRFHPNWKGIIDDCNSAPALRIRRATHQAIQKVSEDINRFAFNTAVSSLMICLNTLQDELNHLLYSGVTVKGQGRVDAVGQLTNSGRPILSNTEIEECVIAMSEAVESYILLLAPMAPFAADELWESLGKQGFTYEQHWPRFDPAIAREDTATIAIQVNGKLRDTLEMPANAPNEELEAMAMASAKVQTHLEGKTVRKVIVISGKLVNIVAN
jgi:leucyl-tRNA synthetase